MTGTTHVQYVDSATRLDSFLRDIDDHCVFAVDTEFIRERTYYPELCLIQIAAGDSIWCIDTLALPDVEPLFSALATRTRLKVFHAARQDLEIFFNETGEIPGPLFDTQIAAALLGRPDQIAYAGLVQEFYALELDKTSSRTNWAQRPLSKRQLDYAAADVRYLEGVKHRLEQELLERGRESWLTEECQRLSQLTHYENNPTSAWRRLKGAGNLAPAQLAIVMALAAWRETQAQARNLPRGWVLKDDRLIALAQSAPRSKVALSAIDGMPPGLIRRYGAELVQAIEAAESDAENADLEDLRLPRLTDAGKSLLQKMLTELRRCAEENDVSAALIATRRDLEVVICGRTNVRLFAGWRDELFGNMVRDMLVPRVRLHD